MSVVRRPSESTMDPVTILPSKAHAGITAPTQDSFMVEVRMGEREKNKNEIISKYV